MSAMGGSNNSQQVKSSSSRGATYMNASSNHYESNTESLSDQQQQRKLHSARSMYDPSSSSSVRGGDSVISERSSRSRSEVPMPHHLPGDSSHNYHQNDYIAQYHQQVRHFCLSASKSDHTHC